MRIRLVAIALSGLIGLVMVNAVISQDNNLHPTFPLLDTQGINVLESGEPISTMQTCGACHDTVFIASHSVHADAGLSTLGTINTERPWQNGIGWYGGWNPITYSQATTLENWAAELGWRHVGGGPLTEADSEMNCFVCHETAPNNAARTAALESGQLAWANTATLEGTGIVSVLGDSWEYNSTAFDTSGNLLSNYINIADPRDINCAQCHGTVETSAETPLSFDPFDPTQWHTFTTGQVFSAQRISNSGLNLANKTELARSWDVHAERVVNCADCHYSLNNPIFEAEPESNRPAHLEFDPRRLDNSDYLERPLHQFANGGAAYVESFPIFENAERACADCHDAVSTHSWLVYPERHMQALACETCHVPEVFAPALESINWTVIQSDGQPIRQFRGVNTSTDPALITGYEPVLLPDDNGRLAPYNVISAWYWVQGDPPQPVTQADLHEAWFDDRNYSAEILSTFDADSDGQIDESELLIDTEEKMEVIAERLHALGNDNPRIMGEAEPYAIHHNVTYGNWATAECSTCHSEDSRLAQPISLNTFTPGGVQPTLIGDNFNGTIQQNDDGSLYFVPSTSNVTRYVLGHDRVVWVDTVGMLIFLASLAGVVIHGGLRYFAARRLSQPTELELHEIYMYSIYERQWHWLQSAVIFGLLFTGLVIHRPDQFAMFSFQGIVLVHNALALILVINATLAAFYHLASGEIRQFLPEPRGFFGQMFAQAKYYLYGIFRREPHPFEKTRDRKMNPIQRLTYLGLLNVLLPLQVITGALMWGAQHVPGLTEFFGGLPLLAPLHSLISWLMATFIVIHVYMTTTGHTPLANIRAMIMGWDDVEIHSEAAGD